MGNLEFSALENRVRKNDRHLRRWARRGKVEAYRIYDRDIPEFSLIVDRYGENAVFFDRRKQHQIPEDRIEDQVYIDGAVAAVAAALEIFPVQVFCKRRSRMKGRDQYERLGNAGKFLTVHEGSAAFYVNLEDYLDTGLFLDHRPIRTRMLDECCGVRFLNLFAYTGSVSVCCALGGGSCTSVDMSKTYIDWAKKNFDLNKIKVADHEFVCQDVDRFLQEQAGKGEPYDLAFVDPPTFSNSKKMRETFDVQRDHGQLIDRTMKLLSAEGLLIFSCNRRGFRLDPGLSERYSLLNISEPTIPPDFRDKRIHVCFEIRRTGMVDG